MTERIGCPKCSFPNGVVVKPDGVNELDPCLYKEEERHTNVTVIVSRCVRCGNVDIAWYPQSNTDEE